MNWSINAWTYLFAITAGVLGYTQFTKKTETKSPEPVMAVAQCHADSITQNKGTTNTNSFRSSGLTLQGGSSQLVNANVRSFTLPKCELAQMLSFTGTTDSVVAELALVPGSNGRDTVDLYFRVTNSDGSYRYYDYSNPCPPICGKEQ